MLRDGMITCHLDKNFKGALSSGWKPRCFRPTRSRNVRPRGLRRILFTDPDGRNGTSVTGSAAISKDATAFDGHLLLYDKPGGGSGYRSHSFAWW